MHSTCGNESSSLGFLVPHPPDGIELSTGMPRGSDNDKEVMEVEGVAVPGVWGGVKEGESKEGGGGWDKGVEGTEELVERLSLVSRAMAGVVVGCAEVDERDWVEAERSTTGSTSPLSRDCCDLLGE